MQEQVIVLGAGAIGLCTALSLAERGLSVRLWIVARRGRRHLMAMPG